MALQTEEAGRSKRERRAGDSGFLEAAEEITLISKWQKNGDKRSIDRLLRAYAPLVAKQAKGFRHYTDLHDDLVQEGNLALLDAAGRFDVERGVRFGTYAGWWVRAKMQEFVMSNRSIVRLSKSREKKSLFFKLRHLEAKMAQDGSSRTNKMAAIAKALNMSLADAERVAAILVSGDQALETTIGGTTLDIGSLLADPALGPEDLAVVRSCRETGHASLESAMRSLSGRERRIVKARRLRDTPKTLREIAGDLGLSTERVRQIEQSAIKKLRATMEGSMDMPGDLMPDMVPTGALARSSALAFDTAH